nr:hypothetical protein TetV2_00375 [Oceanusvirus sp.]
MDHYHIVDAYREAYSLVPLDVDPPTEQLEDRDLQRHKRAARIIKMKHDQLERRKDAYNTTLILIEAAISIFLIIMVWAIWKNTQKMSLRVMYSVLVFCVMVTLGVLVYEILFRERLNQAKSAHKVMKQIYGFDADYGNKTIGHLYSVAKSIYTEAREKKSEEDTGWCGKNEEDLDEEETEELQKIQELKKALDPTLEGGCEGGSQGGELRWWMQNGIMYTMTDETGASVDDMVLILRNLLGANTYRSLEDNDIQGIIEEIIVPRLHEAVAKIYDSAEVSVAGRTNNNQDKDKEQCGAECEQTAAALMDAVMDDKKPSPPAAVLEAAWQDCRPEMEKACKGELQDRGTAANKCEFGCARVHEEKRVIKIPLDGWVPLLDSSSGWREREKPEAGEGEGEASGGGNPSESCLEAGMADENVDVVYFGSIGDGEAKSCYFHDANAKRAEWKKVEGAEGVMSYAYGTKVNIPGADSKQTAEKIFLEIQAVYSPFDVGGHEDIILDELRALDARFSDNDSWYRDTLVSLRHRLKAAMKKADLVVPSIEHLNSRLDEMTAREFSDRVIWTTTMASASLHVRKVRMDNRGDYESEPPVKKIDHTTARNSGLFALSVIASIVGYWTMELEWVAKEEGLVTVRRLFGENYHRHIISMSMLLVFWTVIWINISQGRTKSMFNNRVKDRNTIEFIKAANELRSWLFALTGTLPALSGDDNTSFEYEQPRRSLMIAVHHKDTSILNEFEDGDAPMTDMLSLAQRMEFVNKAQNLIKKYDSCNRIIPGKAVPFPIPEVVIYSASILVFVVAMTYMSRRFKVHEVANRVRRIQTLRKKVYMGDEGAAAQIRGILACAGTDSVERVKLLKNMMVATASIFSVMSVSLLVMSHYDYEMSLESGFLVSRSRCLV